MYIVVSVLYFISYVSLMIMQRIMVNDIRLVFDIFGNTQRFVILPMKTITYLVFLYGIYKEKEHIGKSQRNWLIIFFSLTVFSVLLYEGGSRLASWIYIGSEATPTSASTFGYVISYLNMGATAIRYGSLYFLYKIIKEFGQGTLVKKQ